MDASKIEEYERINGPGSFIPFRTLSPEENLAIRKALIKELRLSETISSQDLVNVIAGRSEGLSSASLDPNNEDLLKMFLSFKLPTSDKLYVNWYQYDDIDEFDALDVIGRLSDIWYPVAEDLEIMDITSRWIVTIEHDGVVVLLRW